MAHMAFEFSGKRNNPAALIGGFALIFMLLAAPNPAAAQATKKIPRIGFTEGGTAQCKPTARFESFYSGLRDLGYTVGSNIDIDRRCYANGDEMRKVLRNFVAAKVDVIVVNAPLPALTARDLTPGIPIVCYSCGDPLGNGLVSNLGRPGGNVTGFASLSAELIGKRLGLLKEAIPGISRVVALINPDNPGTRLTLKALEDAGATLGLAIARVEFRAADQFDRVLKAAAATGAGAILIQDDPFATSSAKQIADLALRLRLPTSAGVIEHAENGALMAYGPDRNDLVRRAAVYVDRILKGAKPGDLPFEQPTKFELVINLKTAKALGLKIPQSVLLQTTRVIE